MHVAMAISNIFTSLTLEYFRNKKWEQDWINTAIDFMWKIWIEEYKGTRG